AHLHALGTAQNAAEEDVALVGRALLRIVEEAQRTHLVVSQAAVVEQNPGDDQRTGERTAPGLVSSGDPACSEPAVELQELLAGAAHGREDSCLFGGLLQLGLGSFA